MKLINWVKNEIIKIIPAVIYFAIAFNLIFFTTGLLLPEDTVRYLNYFSVTIMALVMGKILIIVNMFPWLNAFPHRPMIYNIVWKFFVYSATIFIVEVTESVIRNWVKYNSFEIAWYQLKVELQMPAFWSAALWLFVVFFIFTVFAEFVRVLGKDRIKKMMFG
jgi:hypothetical protein